jgi:hypothetical protein
VNAGSFSEVCVEAPECCALTMRRTVGVGPGNTSHHQKSLVTNYAVSPLTIVCLITRLKVRTKEIDMTVAQGIAGLVSGITVDELIIWITILVLYFKRKKDA